MKDEQIDDATEDDAAQTPILIFNMSKGDMFLVFGLSVCLLVTIFYDLVAITQPDRSCTSSDWTSYLYWASTGQFLWKYNAVPWWVVSSSWISSAMIPVEILLIGTCLYSVDWFNGLSLIYSGAKISSKAFLIVGLLDSLEGRSLDFMPWMYLSLQVFSVVIPLLCVVKVSVIIVESIYAEPDEQKYQLNKYIS